MTRLIPILIGAGILIVGALENPAHSAVNRCDAIVDIATIVAGMRYSGIPQADIVRVIPPTYALDLSEIVTHIYALPDLETLDEKKAAIKDVRYHAEAVCNAG